MRADSLALVLVRRFLGVVFIAYGLVKLFGGQFVYDDWTITRSTADGPFLVWAFYGFSPQYARFIALCELVPALLLLFPRTAFVGAAALLPVALNITVMDFAYGFPAVKYLAAIYTALLLLLVWVEREKVWMLFRPLPRVQAAFAATRTLQLPEPPAPPSRRAQRIIAVASTLFMLWVANLVVESSTDGPEPRAIRIASEGLPAPLVLERSRLQGQSGIGRVATVDLRDAADRSATTRVYLTRLVGFVPWRVDSVVPTRHRR